MFHHVTNLTPGVPTLYDGAPVSGGSRNAPNAIAQMRIKKEKKAARELCAAVAVESGSAGRNLAAAPSKLPSFASGGATAASVGASFAPGLHKF
jgi:hypothetical protein